MAKRGKKGGVFTKVLKQVLNSVNNSNGLPNELKM